MSGIKLCIESHKRNNEESFILYLCRYLNIKHEGIIGTGIGGFNKLKNIKPEFDKAKNNGEKVLLLFDANSNFAQRREYLLKEKKELSIDFELFLFPNNKDNGTFEHLLEKVINEKHKVKIDCFDNYELCIAQYKKDGKEIYNIPVQKSKMYAYMDTFTMSNTKNDEFKKGNWFFDNNEYWDFDSEYLKPLKDFLLKNI